MIDTVIRSAASVCAEIRVVGGASFAALELHLAAQHPDVLLINNANWRAGGMFSSIRAGVADLEGPFLVHPCDIPGAGPEVYRTLLAARQPQGDEVVRPVHGGRGGHPVLLPATLIPEILTAPADATLRDLLAGRPRIDVPVETDLVHVDFDTPAEYELLKARLERP